MPEEWIRELFEYFLRDMGLLTRFKANRKGAMVKWPFPAYLKRISPIFYVYSAFNWMEHEGFGFWGCVNSMWTEVLKEKGITI